MRFTSKNAGATPWWAKRRVLGSALALTALVASGAAAHASSHGDGFFGTMAGKGNTAHGQSYNSQSGQNTMSVSPTNTWTWNGRYYSWNRDMWGWGGAGLNRFAFRAVVDRDDPTFNQLLGINDRGVAVGYFGSGENARHPNRGFLVSSPYMQDEFRKLNFPGSVQTQVVGINNAGTTVGFFVDATGANHGFVRRHGQFHTVDFPGTTSMPRFNQLLGINNHDVAVGFFNDRVGNSHGYLFDARTGRFALLHLPITAKSTVAAGINDAGQVVGFVVLGKNTHGFLWSSGRFTLLRLGNQTNTQALGINNEGVIVGSFVDAAGKTHGFVRYDAHLTRRVDVPGSTSTVVNGLNNRGLIVGFFTDTHKNTLGFIAHR
ncbi:MAG TPA: hypothetical protein VFP72_15595 [Kineosporiaceae bacterium]|nr:hypothetical protein [Kineosporiaceae bacterium]